MSLMSVGVEPRYLEVMPTTISVTSATMSTDTLTVDLTDGRTIAVPLAWYPRLLHASAEDRGHWRLIGRGHGIHWPELDEDISVKNLLDGQPSGESQRSFRDWLDRRMGVEEHSS